MVKAASGHATDDWGTPDPRDADAYPKPASTSPQQWAWEFLRRNPDYRRDWAKHIGRFLNARGELDDAAFESEYAEIIARLQPAGLPFTLSPPYEAVADKYQLTASTANNFLDPRLEHPPGYAMDVVTEISWASWHSGELRDLWRAFKEQLGEQPGKSLIVFDLLLPLEPQLAEARRLLLARAKQHSLNPQFDLFPIYLRLLDFDEENALDSEIGQYLFVGKSGRKLHDKIRKGLEAARDWQARYPLIAGHSPKE
jgi:Proteobacterial transcriptional regulator-like domain